MNWHWNLESLMSEHGISSTKALVEKIRTQYPEAEGEVGETTINLILNQSIDRISQTGLLTLCKFFSLQSLAELVDFDDAIPFERQEDKESIGELKLKFKLQELLHQLGLTQKSLADSGKTAIVTINRFCRGNSNRISFDALVTICNSLQLITGRELLVALENAEEAFEAASAFLENADADLEKAHADLEEAKLKATEVDIRPKTITEVLEIVEVGSRPNHVAIDRQFQRMYPNSEPVLSNNDDRPLSHPNQPYESLKLNIPPQGLITSPASEVIPELVRIQKNSKKFRL